MQLIEKKFETTVLFDTGQNLTFRYNNDGGFSIQVRNDVEEEEGVAVDLNFTKGEAADLVAFLCHNKIQE